MTSTDIDPTAFEIQFDPRLQRMRGHALHGNTPFDVPFISQITENLWQGGCEDGLVLPSFIKHLVSLYPWERYQIRGVIDSELYVVMYDDTTGVNADQIWKLAAHVNECVESGPTLVHCQAGLNRSSLVAAASLLYISDSEPRDVIDLIREKRSPACLCNPTFESWLLEAA